MLGAVLGLAFGAAQLYLLLLGTGVLGPRGLRIGPLVAQFICPLAGLLLCALVRRAQLLPCAVAMSAVLIVGAVVCFVRSRARDSNRKKD